MDNDATLLAWRDDMGWDARRGNATNIVKVDSATWAALPDTLTPHAEKAYRAFGQRPDYLQWWASACGGTAPGIRRFAMSTPADHWERPWEATIAALEQLRWSSVSIVRIGKGPPVQSPQDMDVPLRVMVLQGSETGEGLDRLDLAAELQGLLDARESLDEATRSRVPPIAPRQVGKADLVAELIATKPSLLWLSGHATNDPPGFLMADGSWLTPADLAAAIRESSETNRSVPLYVVLWACRTAAGERYAAPGAAPPFIEALADVGVAGMLATLAPLADDVAIDLAAAILAGIVAGRPLDHAVARGRATLMDEQVDAGTRNDWACPVVWCTALPVGQTNWSAAADDAQRQQLARRLLAPGEAPGELDDAGRVQAGLWSEQPRTWVMERQPGPFQVRAAWLGRVMELQRTGARTVLVLDFANGSARNVIRDWAERAKRVTDGYDDPSRTFRGMLETLRTDPEAGWTLLCEQDNFTLALIEPPEQEAWLLPRLEGAPAHAVVLAGSFPAAAAEDGWRSDTLQVANGVEGVEPPDLPMAAALAVLALPAVAQDLEALDADQFARLRELGYVIETRAGCVMPLSLAAGALAKVDKQGLAAAHRLAFSALDGPAARARIANSASEPLRRARFRHAVESGDLAAHSIAAQELMDLYRAELRPGALLDVFDRTDFRTIDESWKVAAGWARISTGSPDDARDILEDARDDELDPVDRATKMSLMAEVEKSSGQAGSIGRATALLEEALASLGDGDDEQVERERLRIEHDQARLIQFFGGGAAAAAPLYEAIARRWETIANTGLDQAITLRNLAEAEMTIGESAELDAHFDAAADGIAKARDRLPAHTGHPVAPEIEYLAGRLAIRTGDQAAATHAFERAKSVGLATGNLMQVAIVEARLFWRTAAAQPPKSYNAGDWAARAQALAPFRRHAWAARVTIDGYLRSARRLLDQGLTRAAQIALAAARELLDENPGFEGRSDRDRIAATAAGLEITGADDAAWAKLATENGWVGDWMTERHVESAGEAWEVTANG